MGLTRATRPAKARINLRPTAIVLGARLSGYVATKPGFNVQMVTPPRVLQGFSCARDALVNDPSKITVTVR